MKVITFVDSGVLIAAYRGSNLIARRALNILDSSDRVFASSEFVRLEILPKAIHHKQSREVEFYEAFFQSVQTWADPARVISGALREAVEFGLSAFDALHVAAAIAVGATEFVTAEKAHKPIHRVTHFKVTSIADS